MSKQEKFGSIFPNEPNNKSEQNQDGYSPQEKEIVENIEKGAQGWRNIKQAQEIAESINHSYERSKALSRISQAQVQAGDIEGAKETFQQAKETAENINDSYYKSKALSRISQAQVQAGDIEGTKETFQQAKETAENINDSHERSEALYYLAQAQVQVGDIEGTKETAENINDSNYKSKALSLISQAQVQAGDIEGAKETFQQAKETAENINHSYERSEAFSHIARAQAQAGDIEGAKEIAENINDYLLFKYQALSHIARAQAQAGDIEGAKETFQQAKETAENINHSYERSEALSHIARAQAQAGDIEGAKETFQQAKETVENINDSNYKSRALSHIAQAQAQAGSELISQSVENNKNLTLAQKQSLLQKVISLDDKEFAKALGAIITEEEREQLSQEFGERVKDLMRAGYVDVRKSSEDWEKELTKEYSQRLRKITNIVDEEKQEKYTNRLINEILCDLDNDQSVQAVLEVARSLPANHKLLPRIIKTLCEIDNTKASDLAVQFCGQEELPDRIVWYTIHKLIEQKYLPASLGEYLKDKNTQDKKLLKTIRKTISELRLNPDKEVLEYILEREYKDEQTGEDIQDIDKRIKLIKEKKEQFESISDRFELVEKLHQDKDSAILYYILNGGKTRFSLVNSYNSEKFATILKVINEGLGEISSEVLEEYQELLKNNTNYSQAEVEKITENLIQGRWIFEGIEAKDKNGQVLEKQPKQVQQIRIDVSDSAKLEALENKAKGTFGKNQLGLVLKVSFYTKYLEEKGDNELLQEINSLSGLTDTESIAEEIEEKYPGFLDKVEEALSKNWKKLGDKKVLETSLLAVLREDENKVDLKKLLKSLEQQRKSLKYSLNQKFKSLIKNNKGDKEKLLQEKRSILERLEAKDPAKLFGYIVGETIGEDNLTDIGEKILTEWESHLQEIFMDYEKIDKSKNKDIRQKSQTITLRYLDKKEDLIACLRFADSAQCCFTSSQYRIEGHNIGNAEWIARIWKDPLSYVYQIEKTGPNSEKREAVGFVFGFFGDQKGELVTMLNGVYMQNKTNTGAESILKASEDSLSRPIQASRQIVASRYGGTINLPKGYVNGLGEVKRLRALNGQDTDEPEEKIYDDLGTVVNQKAEVDNAVWGKDLKGT